MSSRKSQVDPVVARPLSSRVVVIDSAGTVLGDARGYGGIETALATARELKPLGPVAIVGIGAAGEVLLARFAHASIVAATVAVRRWRERRSVGNPPADAG